MGRVVVVVALAVLASLGETFLPTVSGEQPALESPPAARLADDVAGHIAALPEGPVAIPCPSGCAVRARRVSPVAEPPAAIVHHVRTTQKVVALTFDDGWNPKAGRQILAILQREHIQATFFVNAVYVHRDVAFWRAVAAAGMVVANHTYDHADLTSLSVTAIEADLAKDARIFATQTGASMAQLLRPPFGARDARVDAAVHAAGYPIEVLWDTVANDTTHRSARQMIASATAGKPGSIVLMHVGPDITPKILERVIAAYRKRGFGFVTVPQLLTLGEAR